jgi:Arc/MetJ-type ribon-helix-helix transcriptional regulator
MTMKTVSLKLPEDLDARLESTARRRSWSKSEVVRRALTRFLPSDERSAGPSFADKAASLVGCVEGPEDLSSNPQRLRGYGR